MSMYIRWLPIAKFISKACVVIASFAFVIAMHHLYNSPQKSTDKKRPTGEFLVPPHDRLHYQYIPECKCFRKWMWPPPPGSLPVSTFPSSCSDKGTHLSENQNVLTFSLFLPDGNRRARYKAKWLYANGIRRNLESIRENFPGFGMRLYTNLSLTLNPRFCDFLCANPDVFWCEIEKSPRWGNVSDTFHFTWRLLVLGDPTVDVFLVRDLGPTVSDRDAAVVIDWLSLASQKAIYIVRDDPMHDQPVIPGLWGASNAMLGPDESRSLQEKVIAAGKSIKKKEDWEQEVLEKIIFYPRRDDIVAYDSYYCNKSREFTLVRPIPVERVIHKKVLVDDVEFPKVTPKFPECPDECRPKYGKDWRFC